MNNKNQIKMDSRFRGNDVKSVGMTSTEEKRASKKRVSRVAHPSYCEAKKKRYFARKLTSSTTKEVCCVLSSTPLNDSLIVWPLYALTSNVFCA